MQAEAVEDVQQLLQLMGTTITVPKPVQIANALPHTEKPYSVAADQLDAHTLAPMVPPEEYRTEATWDSAISWIDDVSMDFVGEKAAQLAERQLPVNASKTKRVDIG